MKKYFLAIILFLFFSCASYKSSQETRNLMLIETYQNPRNKKLYDKHKEIRKGMRRYKKKGIKRRRPPKMHKKHY